MKATPQHRHRRFSKVTDTEKYEANLARIFGRKPASVQRDKTGGKKQRAPSGSGAAR